MGIFSTPEPVKLVPPSRSYEGGPDSVSLQLFRELVQRERFEFEVELGAPIDIEDSSPISGARFLIGPARANPAFEKAGLRGSDEARVRFDPDRELLVADGPDLGGVAESLSLLRTLTMTGASTVVATNCRDIGEAIDRVRCEVAATYPAFDLRGIDWDEVCTRHIDRVLETADSFPALQRWVAELQDMHSWVQPEPAYGLLPYMVHVSPNDATFVRVPQGTAAFKAGIRPGDKLLGVDTRGHWCRVGGPSHMRPYLAGRRLMSGPVDVPRTFFAITSNNQEVEFTDTPSYQPWPATVTWKQLPSGTGYLRLIGFPPGVNRIIDDALNDFGDCERLIVDLRGNAGGLLVEALDFRDRLVEQPMRMGTIQFSSPEGGLSRHEPIQAEPTTAYTRWTGQARFLTDPMTASASEDALLGLQGLPHVKVIGTRTAGGSGRPRSIRLLPGMRLSVSTALTYDRNGHCIEGNGIPPNIHVPFTIIDPEDHTLQVADRSW